MRESTLLFASGAETVTGANFLLNTGGRKVLIDCGMLQGSHKDANAEPFRYDPQSIDVLLVTHAHADHIGRIPKLVKEGFVGVIYSTPATRDLAEVMFEDAVRIVAHEAHKEHREPLYTHEHVSQALALWKTQEYHESFSIGDDVFVRFLDAGHVLGAAMVEFSRGGRVFVATGDLGNSPAPLLRDTEEVVGAHYMLIESVYGDRLHEDREQRVALLRDALRDTIVRKRTLLIPSFSIQRTQILLYEINKMVERGEIDALPVYLDSPLARKVTDVYRRYTGLLNERVQSEIHDGDDIFSFPKFTIVETVQESQQLIDAPAPKVIIAGSGMSVGGRVLMHEEKLLSSPDTTILFVGYQGVGTLGRQIQDGAHHITIGEKRIRVRAEKRTIRGFSAHKDRDGLLTFVEKSRDTLEHVYVAMGEPKAALFLVQRIRDFLGVPATAARTGELVTLRL